jgi:hypothetical protein
MVAPSSQMSSSLASRWSPRAMVATLTVFAGAALGLRALDAIPCALSGLPRGVHACATLDEAEARTGVQLAFAKGLAGWQPSDVRATARPVPAIAVVLRASGPSETRAVLYRSLGPPIPNRLFAPLASFHAISVSLEKGRIARLKAEVLPGGGVVQELEWSDANAHTVLRSSGRTVELLGLAKRLVEKDP